MSFAELGLSDKVLKAAAAAGYTTPTPIQKQAIPHVLARKDVLGIAQTGTGKTAAFTLPMLTLLESGRARARMPRTLILEPTRELAAQVEENFVKYGSEHKLSVALLIGGVSFGDQDAKITRGADVLIATPGRLLDHFERGKLLLTGVELFVIDEADRMLDMGFIPDIERIAKLVPFTRQTLFFSATMPPEIQRLADAFLHNPVKVEVARAASTASTITQLLVSTGPEPHQKRATLRDLIRDAVDLKNAIVFCNRKRDVATLHRSLARHGFQAVALHGDMDQRARMQALDSFRNGESTILVASDVAARGLDIPDVSHVFNYDVPYHAEDYVHRIGRTGRAGRTGTAITLIARGDEKALQAIEDLIGQKIQWQGKPLSERTQEDDSYSAPDRGLGWKRENSEHGNDRNHRRGRHNRGKDQRSNNGNHKDNRNHHQQQQSAAEPQRHDQRRDDRRNNNNSNKDHHRRRDRYDNEPDISVIGFGDHIPAFIAKPVVFSDSSDAPVPAKTTAERKPVTPISSPPRDLAPEETEKKPQKASPKPKPSRKKEAVEETVAVVPVTDEPAPAIDAKEDVKAEKPEKAKKAPARKAVAKKTTTKAKKADKVEKDEPESEVDKKPKAKSATKTATAKAKKAAETGKASDKADKTKKKADKPKARTKKAKAEADE